jgi:hypothetical protein
VIGCQATDARQVQYIFGGDAKMWEKIQSDGTSSVAKFEVNNRITNVVSTLNAEDAFGMLELVIGHYYDPVSKVDHFLKSLLKKQI